MKDRQQDQTNRISRRRFLKGAAAVAAATAARQLIRPGSDAVHADTLHPYSVNLPVVASSQSGTSFYVDSITGNDNDLGTSTVRAWRSLRRVFSAFVAGEFRGGDRLFFRRGCEWTASSAGRIYVRNVRGLAADRPFYIGAYGTDDGKPRLNGYNNMWASAIVQGSDPSTSHVVVEDLHLIGSDAQEIYLKGVTNWRVRRVDIGEGVNNLGLAVLVLRSSDINFEGCTMTTAGSNQSSIIYLGTYQDLTDQPTDIRIVNCDLHQAGAECVDFKSGARRVTIENCRMSGAPLDGVVSLRGTDHVVRGNTISNQLGNGRGITIWDTQPNSRHTIEGNVITDTRGDGIRIAGNDHRVVGNHIMRCAGVCLRIFGGGHYVSGNEFANAASGVDVNCGWYQFQSDFNDFRSLSSYYTSNATPVSISVVQGSYHKEQNSTFG